MVFEVNSMIGKEIGNYKIEGFLRRGAFGSVYRARHTYLTRIAAIKMLHAQFDTQEDREQFLKEAQFLATLEHRYILPIYDFGIYREEVPYIVTQIASHSLRDRLDSQKPDLLPMEEVLSILSQIGEALTHAHTYGVIHRDLKPENILFNAKGEVLLADFGVATTLPTAGSSRHVRTIVGTFPYMAPEQFDGMASRRSDQYALGCIAYELFTGRVPFSGTDLLSWMVKHTNEQPKSLRERNPQLPVYIEQAILKALAKNRTDRYADISDFIEALHRPTSNLSRDVQEGVPPIPPEKFPPTGTPFKDKCPYCGAEVRPEENSCPNCRNQLNLTNRASDQHMPGVTVGTRFMPTLPGQMPIEEVPFPGNSTVEAQSSSIPILLPSHKTKEEWLEEGDVHYRAKRYQEALAAYKRAIQLDPQNAQAYRSKGNSLRRLRRYEEALAAYNDALNITPDNAAIWNSKGEVLYKLERYSETLDAYEHSLAINVKDAFIWTAKGNVLYKLEHYEEALVAYNRALTITLKKTDIWVAKGEVLYKLECYEEALDAYTRALARKPNDASIASKCDMVRELKRHKEKSGRAQTEDRPSSSSSSSQSAQSPPKHGRIDESAKQQVGGTILLEHFDVFLSHSDVDTEWVEKNLAMPLADENGFRVWLDKWLLIPGQSFQQAMARGLDQAHCCAVCIGEHTPIGWFEQQIERALNRQAQDSNFRVIPVLLPKAKDINVDKFLALKTLADFRGPDRAYAFHVLVCGVKGVPIGRWPPQETMTSKTNAIVEDMLLDLEQLEQRKLITSSLRDEYSRITMEKVWLPGWIKAKDNTNE
jgi:serine/threonine protein kinase